MWRNCNLQALLVGNVKCCGCCEKVSGMFSKKLNTEFSYDLATLFLGIYQEETHVSFDLGTFIPHPSSSKNSFLL